VPGSRTRGIMIGIKVDFTGNLLAFDVGQHDRLGGPRDAGIPDWSARK
jgi:hypothetical protein